MNCPKCQVALKPIEVKSVTVDQCPACGGTWYDQGELRQLKNRESNGDYGWIDVDLWQDAGRVKVERRSGCHCPKDDVAMATVRYGAPEIGVDVCPVCFGLWLEKGEYDKVIRHLEEKVDSETLAGYLADAEEEFVELFTSKESVKKELSDLGKVFHLLGLRFAVEHPTLVAIKEAIRHLIPE